MRFFSQDAFAIYPVRWFFCVKGAQPLPFPTVFNSANWDSTKGVDQPLGEVRGAKRIWRDGSLPPWGLPPHTCQVTLSSLPDTMYMVVVNGGTVDPEWPYYQDGFFVKMDRVLTPFKQWETDVLFWALPGGNTIGVTFGCNPIIGWNGYDVSVVVDAWILAYDYTGFGMMKGTTWFGLASTWLSGVPVPVTIPFGVDGSGKCPKCGPSVWLRPGLDIVALQSADMYSQPLDLIFTPVNPQPDAVYFTFSVGYFPPDLFPELWWA